jgi:hypothetical protein
MISLERVLDGSMRLGVLRGFFHDDEGEEVGAIWDEIDFHPNGTFEIILDALHGEASNNYKQLQGTR